MKKIKVLLTTISFIFIFLAVVCITPNVAAATISVDSIDANSIVNGNGVTATYTSEGILATVPGESSVSNDAWQYGANILADASVASSGNISNGSIVSMEFSIEYFDKNGNKVSYSRNGDAIDLYVYDRANNAQLAMLRIWANGGGQWDLGNHSCEVYGSGWNPKIYSTPWINGDATLSSSFYIQFDKTELFKSYVNMGDSLARLDDNGNQLLNTVNTSGVDSIYFRIQGDNGFTNDTRILVRSINGQSLAKSSGGQQSDIPYVSASNSATSASLVSEGVKVLSNGSSASAKFGEYDLSYGLDVKFIVPKVGTSGTNPDNSFIDLVLTNSLDSSYTLKYRIWLAYEGDDRPTNVFITTSGNTVDYSEAGWLSRKVDGVEDKYHMAFDMTDTLLGERKDGMLTQIGDETHPIADKVSTFINSCPSTKFNVGIEFSGGSSGYYEYVVTEINEQSLENVGGVYENVKDAVLYVKDLPEVVVQNSNVVIYTYSKDVLMPTENALKITTPSGSVEERTTTGSLTYNFNQLGDYTIEVSTTGSNGNVISKTYTVKCKSKVSNISFNIPTYSSIGQIGDEVTILAGSNYSSSVVTKEIIVVMPWTNEERKVNVGDKLKLDGPGIYTIRYVAKDDAQPTPNEVVKEVYISVMDETKPVVTTNIPTTAKTGDVIKFNVTVEDQSDYDVNIYITYPDQSVKRFSLTDDFIPTKSGTYQIKVSVEDMYWNIEEVILELVVTGEDIEDSGSGDGDGDDLFDDDPFDDPFEDSFEDDSNETPEEGGDGTFLIVIAVIIVALIPGVLVYIIKSRKFK